MEFLVRIEVRLPESMPEERRRSLVDAESVRGRELIEQGTLVRIWRVPGRWANVSLYRVADATELHAAVSSLPLWPWMNVEVEPLATHPLEA
ncbi:MAG: muconolactone Delta-isomerase [Gaiellales bacterium]